MKNTQHFTRQITMASLVMLCMTFCVPGFLLAQTSKEYTVAEVGAFIADLEIGANDIYVLSTPGGIYDVDYLTIPRNTIIKAKEGLATRPVLLTSTSNKAIFRANGSSVRDTIIFENVEFDGTGSSPLIIRSDDETHLVFKGCYVHDVLNFNGAIRLNVAGSSIDIQNTLFANCGRRLINVYAPGELYGDVTITNCTFSNILEGEVVYFRSAGPNYSSGNNITIDHCTFFDISGLITRYQEDSIHGIVSVTNSIFEQVDASELKADSVDYNYLAGFTTPPAGTNSITTAPVFADAANMNFALTNLNELTGGDFQILGDLSWYEDIFPPAVFADLLKLDSTHVGLRFNEPVADTTAVVLANYVLTGTGGLTGNPSEAVLEANSKYVILTIEDISGLLADETVIITVSNVSDMLGNVISDNNVATLTVVDEVPPIVTMDIQAVTNDPGESAIAQSNELGKIYLVHVDMPQSSIEDFEAAANTPGWGFVAEVGSPNLDLLLSTAKLMVGEYYAYAVDMSSNISARSANAVTVSDVSGPEITMAVQEVSNDVLGFIQARSNEQGSVIYLILDGEAQSTVADFDAAIAAKKGATAMIEAPDEDVSISSDGLEAGTYFGYAVDLAGNISSKSTNAITVTEHVDRVRYYEETDADQLADDLNTAIDGDVFILETSGGNYKYSANVRIVSRVTILAADDLAERPVLRMQRESTTTQILRLFAEGSSITVKGIEFDSESREPGLFPSKHAITTQPDIGNYSLTVVDCYFRGKWRSNNDTPGDTTNGAAVKLFDGTHADSIIFRNCIFDGDEGIVLNSTGAPFGWNKFEISNCTFMNIPDDPAILIAQRGDNKYLPLTVDHCTFYGVGGLNEEVLRTDSLYTINLMNSIFGTTMADTSLHLWGDGINKATVDYTNFFECVLPLVDEGGFLGANTWTGDPQFADPANGDLTLGNQALYSLGSDGLPLGDLRWADIFGPKTLTEMTASTDSTLILKFDEWIDTTSAEIPANYEVAGSSGFTAVVKKAELINFRSVLLTVESFFDEGGSELAVTVSNVEDLKGNVVDPSHNMGTYQVEQFRAVISVEAQTVTNGPGQLAVVQSSKESGWVYLVLEGESQSKLSELNQAVSAKKGAKSPVSVAFMDIEIDVSGIDPGIYNAYAVDSASNLSKKSVNVVTVTDGIPPVVTNMVQSTGNGDPGFIVARSNELGKLYIVLDLAKQENEADLIAATNANEGAVVSVTAPDTDEQISTKDLVPGAYFTYAVDLAGNMSQKGVFPVAITDATGIKNGIRDQLNVYSLYKKIVVEASGTGARYIVISDLLGRRVLNKQIWGDLNEFQMDNNGIYIIRIWSDKEVINTTKLIVQ